jgi:RNA polymerase-binding transcription factor DksA
MNINTSTPAINNQVSMSSGFAWNRLHSEREHTCEALLGLGRPNLDPPSGRQEKDANEESTRDVEWRRRELLSARLRQLDDALDRVMNGSYGNCSCCGRWIEDTRLAADPAVPFCIACQRNSEEVH